MVRVENTCNYVFETFVKDLFTTTCLMVRVQNTCNYVFKTFVAMDLTKGITTFRKLPFENWF